MADRNSKVSASNGRKGADGQVLLARGERISLRMWDKEAPTSDKPRHRHSYEVVGYAVAGRAELVLDGETIPLGPGDSWCVPANVEHTYRILETFTAVEALSPAQEGH